MKHKRAEASCVHGIYNANIFFEYQGSLEDAKREKLQHKKLCPVCGADLVAMLVEVPREELERRAAEKLAKEAEAAKERESRLDSLDETWQEERNRKRATGLRVGDRVEISWRDDYEHHDLHGTVSKVTGEGPGRTYQVEWDVVEFDFSDIEMLD